MYLGTPPRPNRRKSNAPGWNRTTDTRFRKPLLYPLSYEDVCKKALFFGVFELALGGHFSDYTRNAKIYTQKDSIHPETTEAASRLPALGSSVWSVV